MENILLCKTCAYYNQNYSTCDYCQRVDYEFYKPNPFTLTMACILAVLMGIGFTIICMVLSGI